jgi:hypothetical protein
MSAARLDTDRIACCRRACAERDARVRTQRGRSGGVPLRTARISGRRTSTWRPRRQFAARIIASPANAGVVPTPNQQLKSP